MSYSKKTDDHKLWDLANKLDQFAYDFDFYDWADSFDENDFTLTSTVEQLARGQKHSILAWLNYCRLLVEEDETEWIDRIEELQQDVLAA